MKKKETREITATYCDYCGKELTYSGYTSIQLNEGAVMDFCDESTSDGNKTCLKKYKERMK